mmetsp:Transcript_31164/g.62507  ORF Transcript_31164/g.62507 Transcript_31164/m.62507 type:complete len:226 (+) Transcript_31164:494-1171(+)
MMAMVRMIQMMMRMRMMKMRSRIFVGVDGNAARHSQQSQSSSAIGTAGGFTAVDTIVTGQRGQTVITTVIVIVIIVVVWFHSPRFRRLFLPSKEQQRQKHPAPHNHHLHPPSPLPRRRPILPRLQNVRSLLVLPLLRSEAIPRIGGHASHTLRGMRPRRISDPEGPVSGEGRAGVSHMGDRGGVISRGEERGRVEGDCGWGFGQEEVGCECWLRCVGGRVLFRLA